MSLACPPLKWTLCVRLVFLLATCKYDLKRWHHCKLIAYWVFYWNIRCTQILGTNGRMHSQCVPGPFSRVGRGLGMRLYLPVTQTTRHCIIFFCSSCSYKNFWNLSNTMSKRKKSCAISLTWTDAFESPTCAPFFSSFSVIVDVRITLFQFPFFLNMWFIHYIMKKESNQNLKIGIIGFRPLLVISM